MSDDETCLQESPAKKAVWLLNAEKAFPIGSRVRIKDSDLPAYVGQLGEVVGYCAGCNGTWPLVTVRLDSGVTDGFYDDGELEHA